MTRRFTPKILSREEERDLLARWKDSRDLNARDRLVLAHQPLVHKVCAHYRRSIVPKEDLFQEGILGLMKAADRFDMAHDVRFSTYAVNWVRYSVVEYMLRHSQVVRGPTGSAGQAAFFRGEWMDIVAIDAKGLNGKPLADSLPSVDAGPEHIASRSIDGERAVAALRAMDSDDRRATILNERFFGDRVTLESIAGRFGVGKERIRQIEAQGVDMLRRALNVEVTA